MTPLRRHMFALLLIAGAMFPNIFMAGSRESSASQPSPAQTAKNLPGYLREATDSWSGTTFLRITEPGILGLAGVCGKKYCTHRYSSAQAWNADQSLLVIVNGCGGMCFLDGHSYVPLFHRDRSNETECEWHPRDPQL